MLATIPMKIMIFLQTYVLISSVCTKKQLIGVTDTLNWDRGWILWGTGFYTLDINSSIENPNSASHRGK